MRTGCILTAQVQCTQHVLIEGQHSIETRKNKHFSIGRIYYENRSKPREALYSMKVTRKTLK